MTNSPLITFVYATRESANLVLDAVLDLTKIKKFITIADVCDLSAVPSVIEDEKWGWTDLSSVFVTSVEGGFQLVFPTSKFEALPTLEDFVYIRWNMNADSMVAPRVFIAAYRSLEAAEEAVPVEFKYYIREPFANYVRNYGPEAIEKVQLH